MVKLRTGEEGRRLRDGPCWKKRDKSKKIAERQKRQHRKDEKLVDVARVRANIIHLSTVFLYRGAGDIPVRKHAGRHAVQGPIHTRIPRHDPQPRHT
jgi:hypothetical protein